MTKLGNINFIVLIWTTLNLHIKLLCLKEYFNDKYSNILLKVSSFSFPNNINAQESVLLLLFISYPHITINLNLYILGHFFIGVIHKVLINVFIT